MFVGRVSKQLVQSEDVSRDLGRKESAVIPSPAQPVTCSTLRLSVCITRCLSHIISYFPFIFVLPLTPVPAARHSFKCPVFLWLSQF
ncbi:hypothetical protein FKM82_017219 [Ascaphus truei]